jgi:hypothetical protein
MAGIKHRETTLSNRIRLNRGRYRINQIIPFDEDCQDMEINPALSCVPHVMSEVVCTDVVVPCTCSDPGGAKVGSSRDASWLTWFFVDEGSSICIYRTRRRAQEYRTKRTLAHRTSAHTSTDRWMSTLLCTTPANRRSAVQRTSDIDNSRADRDTSVRLGDQQLVDAAIQRGAQDVEVVELEAGRVARPPSRHLAGADHQSVLGQLGLQLAGVQPR